MAAPARQIEPTQPKTALDEQIAQVVREMLAEQGKQSVAARVSAESSFERDLGLGSLDLVELLVRCEARLEIAVPDEVAEQADTPAGWAKAILQGGEEAAKSVYRIVRPPMDAPRAPVGARTLMDVLRQRAQATPDRIVLHLAAQTGGLGRTGAQLLEAAERLARGLISQGVRAQDRVAILLPSGIDFFEAFLGVQLAGATPVPLYGMANAGRLDEYANQQGAILREIGATALVIDSAQRGLSRILRALAPDLLGAFEPERLRAEGKRTWVDLPGPTLAAPAFVQFTAGVTGVPKAIAVTHEALLADLKAVGERLELQPGDAIDCCLATAGGWGLTLWQLSIYFGLPLTQLAPQEFAERPEAWLWAIHNSRSTISAAPNSAYDICARRVPLWTVDGLDLSRWRCAILVGELVLPETVTAFTRRFGAFGFRPEALRTAYGVTEAGVLTLSHGGRAWMPDEEGFFPVGEVLPGNDVRAVEGQVEFRSAGTRAWVGTGDLGYFRNGCLVVNGRSKEAIQRQGVSAHQIEAAAGAVAGIASGAVAAFAVRDGSRERLVLAAESAAAHSSAAAGVIALLRRAVQEKTGTQLDEIVLAAPGTLPRTGDGRIRRLPARFGLAVGVGIRHHIGKSSGHPRGSRLRNSGRIVTGRGK